eukprot:s1234_g12.t1
MEVLEIHMDITRYVRTSKGIDKDKFLLHTAPNRASTGLRYVRVMKGLMTWVESFDPIHPSEHPSPLECLRLVEYMELLMQKGVGYNTPQTLLFAIDFFSKAFGFNPTGQEWNRSKRLAMRYKKSKPGLASRAPLFGKETLRALELIVLDCFAPIPNRVAAGKLRLCCQAAIRYDDLLHTPLSSLEWVRRKGGTTVVAVRAKSTQGKNKARPWIASLMGTCQENDKWLCTLLGLVLSSHGSSWSSDDHFGKEPSRDMEGFTRKPSRLESDVATAKEALRAFKKGGGDPGMDDREVDLLRWHGGKATLTSLMQHLELDPKMIRLAGDWAAKEDAMPDTYLREAQLMVLRGQESCLAYLRSGGDFGRLISSGLVGAGPPTGDGDVGGFSASESHGGAGGCASSEADGGAEEARRKVQARLAGLHSEYQGQPGRELCKVFLDKGFDAEGKPLVEVAEEESKIPALPAEEIQKFLESDNPEDDVYVVYSFDGQKQAVKAEPVDEKQEGETGVSEVAIPSKEPLDAVMEDDDDDQEGRTLRFTMVNKPTSASKLHLPAVGRHGQETSILVPTPKCGAKGAYDFVMAGDAIDQSTELCIRCFGYRSEGACGKLCRDLPVTLLRAAARFDVAESDFLLLQQLGFSSLNAIAFKLPKADDLEKFLEDHILSQNAFKQADGIVVTFPRQPPEQWTTWKLSDDAAALRRLWAFAKETAKSEIEKMSSGDESRKKITLIEATAMEAAALTRGCPAPNSDRERPSLYTLNRLGKALQTPGASYEVLTWETFISKEEEDRLTREGKIPRHGLTELILGKDSKVVARDKADEAALSIPRVREMEVLRARLELRARSMEYLELAHYSTMRSLSDRYYSKLNSSVAAGMRTPTLNELRRFDREMQVVIYRHLSRGQGSLEDAVRYYADDDSDSLWRLLDPVLRQMPDQGIDEGVEQKSDSGVDAGAASSSSKPPKTAAPDGKGLITCLICKKKHTPLCSLKEFRVNQRERKKVKKAQKKAAAAQAKAKAAAA